MDSEDRPARKARKSMRGQGNAIAEPINNESTSNATSSLVSNALRKSARKSTGTPSVDQNTSEKTQPASKTTRCLRGSSQDTTLSLSQPSCSRDNTGSDFQPQRTKRSLANSLNSTVPFSQPSCSRDPDSSDSDISPAPTQKILRRKAPTPASKSSKKPPVVSSSPSSTSEESEVEEMSKKKAAKESKTQAKTNKTSSNKTADVSNKTEKQLVNPSNLVSQCVFYILVANRNKKAIKKSDIIKNVFEGRNTNLFPEILKKAASQLQKTFGFELMELKSSKNEYLLVNSLCYKYEIQEFTEYSRKEGQFQGLIFYLLTLIFMNNNAIMEDELWKALDPLGVDIKSRNPHPIFGDVQKLVTNTLVKQMYLERRQISKDPPQYELSFGERAHKEVLKEDLLNFVCKIMPDTKPEEWIMQYKDAKGRVPEEDGEME